jgi:hypothetical protein
MKTIEAFFVRVKHWQLFLLIVGVSVLDEVAGVVIMTANDSSTGSWGAAGLAWGFVTAIAMLCLVGWWWAVGTFLNSTNPETLRLKTGFFQLALFYPIAYICAAGLVFLSPKPSMIAVILPLHFFAIFCLFYVLRFASKSLAMAETGRQAKFYDYAGPFFLMWFFPIGIWFVQPRINRLYSQRMQSKVVDERNAVKEN